MIWTCEAYVKIKHTFRLPPALSVQMADYAARKRVSQALLVETALESFLSPDSSERLEAAITRRIDRLSRQADRLERNIEICNEAVALFVQFWLTNTPPVPDDAQSQARASGRERYGGYIAALGRRMEKGGRLAKEIVQEG